MTSDELKVLYDRFFALGGPPSRQFPSHKYRRKITSMRLPGCQLLTSLVAERKPDRVLDLGSGITTLVLRTLQRETGMYVVTTDTSSHWLDVTMRELERDGLSTEHCYEQNEFEKLWEKMATIHQYWGKFDLICVDIGSTDFRVSLAPKIAEWCAPGGILVCDDFRLRKYGERMGNALWPYGFVLKELPETQDEFGQTLGTAERN